ncbi:MAG: hypothetical protein U0K54_04070 [Acutalibacteraceae bacterium]|nr:hypothetical protein [Acutalibacteraceae bacterium]
MFLILFVLLLAGLIFCEILFPIGELLIDYAIVIYILCGISLALYSVKKAKERNSILFGLGTFFGLSQLLYFSLSLLIEIAELLLSESDKVLNMIVILIVGGLGIAYAIFNYNMVMSAINDDKHKGYVWIVGLTGWLVLLIISIL